MKLSIIVLTILLGPLILSDAKKTPSAEEIWKKLKKLTKEHEEKVEEITIMLQIQESAIGDLQYNDELQEANLTTFANLSSNIDQNITELLVIDEVQDKDLAQIEVHNKKQDKDIDKIKYTINKLTVDDMICIDIQYKWFSDVNRTSESGNLDFCDHPKPDEEGVGEYVNENITEGGHRSPDWNGNGWYRFKDQDYEHGMQMATTAPPVDSCGTKYPGYLNETTSQDILKLAFDEAYEGVVCFNDGENDCFMSEQVYIKKCENRKTKTKEDGVGWEDDYYFIYLVKETPQCPMRYCGEPAPPPPTTTTKKPWG